MGFRNPVNDVAVTGTVSVGNNPTVGISSSANTVQVSNTVTISGSVSISNTPNVNVANQPTVLISGTGNTVQVSNTVAISGTVSIGNTPTVGISGTANTVQVSNTVAVSGSVSVTNTPNVNVSNSPTVSISGTGNTVQVSNTVTVSGTINIGNQPTVLISGTGNTVQVSNTVAISGSVSITSGTVTIGGTPNVVVNSGTVNIGGQPITTQSPQNNLGSVTVAAFTASANGTFTLPAGTQSLLLSLNISAVGNVSAISVKGLTSNIVYHNSNNKIGQGFLTGGVIYVAVDSSVDSQVIVTLTLSNTSTSPTKLYVTATIDPGTMAVMGTQDGPPVNTSIPPAVTYTSAQSTGATTTILAGQAGRVMRLWGTWVTGRAAAAATAVTAELQDTNGGFLLIAEGLGSATATLPRGGLELPAGVGVQLVGAGVNSMVGGIDYDWVN